MIPKFRAWDKERQKWSPYRIQSLNHVDEVFILFFDTVQGVWYSNEDIKDNWVLMQSTGLKDKNGVEIYEGDILRAELGYELTRITGDVYWNTYNLNYDVVDGHVGYHLSELSQIEVIGNIYENMELIK